jgi:L-alanine-DL-glutamate epimerase-like enolase superfamily enzyme
MSAPIAAITVEPVERPFVKAFRNAKVHLQNLSYIRVAVRSENVVGHGEMTAMPGYSSETIASMTEAIGRHYAPAIIDLDALSEGEIEQAIQGALPGNPYARSAVELALWDLRGKLLGTPVSNLIGGAVRQEVPIGAIVALDTPDEMASDAQRWHRLGARTFQVKIAADPVSSEARVRAVRAVVGGDSVIAVDGNGSFTLANALRTMDAIAAHRVAFFEQPVAVWDFDAMASLVRRGIIPVVADECLVTSQDALRLVRQGAADGFNLKLAKSGIAETRRIIAIADAAGIPCGLGSMLETRFGTLAGIHMAATLRNPLFAAELVGPWMVRDNDAALPELNADAFAWKLPTGPGWGVDPG